MKEKFPDPYEMFFGSMLLSDVNRQFEFSNLVKAQWFTLNPHKYLYECLRHHSTEGREMTTLTAAEWFKSKNMLGEEMSVVYLSRLSQRIGYLTNGDLMACVREISRLYFQQLTFGFHNAIGRSITPESFNLSYIRDEVDRFQKQLDEEYMQESEETNRQTVQKIKEQHEKASKGEMPGISIGFNSLSHILLEPVDFMVIGARPSMGKTAFILSAAYNLIFLRKMHVVIFSLEMSKIQIVRRLISIGTGIPEEDIKLGRCTSEQQLSIDEFQLRPELDLITIYEGSHKASDIIRKTAILSKKQSLDCVMIDYLQKVSPERQNMDLRTHVSFVSNQIKNLSMNLKIPTIALAQLSRSVEQRGGEKRPVLSDLRESGEIEQDASIVAFLHRPEYYGIMQDEAGESTEGIGELILAKNRGGKIGITRMNFHGETMKWSDYVKYIPLTLDIRPNSDFDNKKNELPF